MYFYQVNSGYLKHVMAVFERAGYIRGDAQSSWDVLWAHDYPFKELSAAMATLKPYQKVCHFYENILLYVTILMQQCFI